MKKKLFKVQFLHNQKEIKTIYANKINPSSFLGLIEVSDIVFIDSSEILINPDDEKIRKEFKDVERTFLPINTIIRIDEVILENETPVIKLYKEE
jgi:hypothetical protein